MDQDITSKMDSVLAIPESDSKVFKEYPYGDGDLPQRIIYNVNIYDRWTGTLQELHNPKWSRRLHFKGWVPIEGTIYDKDALAQNPVKHICIFGGITDWKHQYDPARPDRSIISLMSHGVGWYEIKASSKVAICRVSPMCPLPSNVFVQFVVNMGIKDDLNVLIPQAAVLLDEPESAVGQTLQTHMKQLLEVGAIDSIIRESNFYKTWVPDPAEPSGKLRARSPSPDDFEYEGDDTFTDDMEPTFDSETDVQSSHNNRHHGHNHEDDTSNSDVNSSPPAPAASEPPLPIVFHDMADCEVIPELEAEVEADDEFFSEINGSARRTISVYMQFISSKFGPPSTLCSPEQRSSFVQYRDAPENHV
ncbi:hypothetical protein BGZ89_002817 [Linnemannia elongata]|nr:hypothetical protein BGZ89_002817 [Linnemannia elongata]